MNNKKAKDSNKKIEEKNKYRGLFISQSGRGGNKTVKKKQKRSTGATRNEEVNK